MTKKIGRPPVPKHLHRDSLLSVRFSGEQRLQLERAAAGEKLSTWARRALLTLAQQIAPSEPTPRAEKSTPALPPDPPKSAPRAARPGRPRTVEDALRFIASDDPIKSEVRQRVHADCVLPGERVLGKYGPGSDEVVCSRCRRPAPEGKIVVAGKRTP